MIKTLLKKYKRFVVFIEIVLFFSLLPVLYNLVPLNNVPRTFYIYSSGIDNVSKALNKNGYTVTWIDRLMMQVIEVPKEGWYSVDHDAYNRLDFFKMLYKQKTKTMDVVVYAGETAEELTSRLANDMKLDQKKLLAYYRKHTVFKEADVFADRYTLARNADEDTTMSYLFNVSRRALVSYAVEHFKEEPEILELKVLLTMASIIQKESNSVKEMPLISSVIYNRLEKGMKLQMDSTLNYGKYSHTIVTPERIKTDTSYYNTYKHKGLPIQPLGTVTLDAMYAAKYPADSDYIFFMLSPKGGHSFSVTYAEHLANIKTFRIHQKKKQSVKQKEKLLKEKVSFKTATVVTDTNKSISQKKSQ